MASATLLGGFAFLAGALLDFGRVLHVDGWDMQGTGVLAMTFGILLVLLPPLFRSPWGHPPLGEQAPSAGLDFLEAELVEEQLTLDGAPRLLPVT